MKYTDEDIYEGMKFINESGRGSTFLVHDIGTDHCSLTCTVVKSSHYEGYKSNSYPLTSLIHSLERGEFIEITKKEPVYEIY